MSIKPIDPVADPRVESRYAVLNGIRTHYIYGEPPSGTPDRGTVFLIHGWPDLAHGWRFQIPLLLHLGFRVVVPDLIGFGGTDAPRAPPAPLELYSVKSTCDRLAELARQLDVKTIVLGGHDWGGLVAYRLPQYHPALVSHLFVVCTPYVPPALAERSLADVVAAVPGFGYQAQLAGKEVEEGVKSREEIGGFLRGMFGGRRGDGQAAFVPETGVRVEGIGAVGESGILKGRGLEFYIDQYARNGMHGTLNWYRTTTINSRDEKAISDTPTITIPTLFISATNDSVLKPEMSAMMEGFIPDLTRREVGGSHWVLVERPEEVNEVVKGWVEGVVVGGRSKL